MEKFYITTAIYYVNDTPHIGSISEVISADVIARYKRLKGFDVFFSTGTDEHSQKIEMRALSKGINPQEFVNSASSSWRSIFDKFKISYNRFIRTSDEDHVKVVQGFFNKLYEKGDIYLGQYEGWYCVRDETFLKDSDLIDGKCPYCGGEVQKVKEENYFFKLSKYQEALLRYYKEHKEFLRPESRYNEIVNIIKSGLQDISVSRKSFKFGIPVPFDESQTIYVWFDALINYITAIGFYNDKERFEKYWPADLHIIGKDITRFHGIVWPAMLLSYGLPLPNSIFAHGFWNLEGARMSKSLGNVVHPLDFVNKFSEMAQVSNDLSIDTLRYYLSREINFGQDGDFKLETYLKRYNADLANDYGNLINRTLTMLDKYNSGTVPSLTHSDNETVKFIEEEKSKYTDYMDKLNLSSALEEVWKIISYFNNYIQVREPWKHQKGSADLNDILYNLIEGIRISTVLLLPFMPFVGETILKLIESYPTNFNDLSWGSLKSGIKVQRIPPVFPRINLLTKSTGYRGVEKIETKETKEVVISYNDFSKLDFRVAEIVSAEKVENSEKLIKINVSLGIEERIIVAGIGKFYQPEELIGKKIIIIKNLEPREIMGIKSNGMLLAASNKNGLSLITIDKDMPVGTKIS
jgi:methionyl-tRNA synthetase